MWKYLDNVTKKQVGLSVSLFNIFKEIAKTQRVSLELQIGVLATRDFIQINISIATLHGNTALKWRVEGSGLLPVS